MYLITDRFILQFHIVYLIEFYISVYFYNPTAQNIWDFPQITTKWSKVIYFVVDMEYVDESDVVIHCEAYTAMYLRENRFDHLIFTRKIKTGKYNYSLIIIFFLLKPVCGAKTPLVKFPQRASLATFIITVVTTFWTSHPLFFPQM